MDIYNISLFKSFNFFESIQAADILYGFQPSGRTFSLTFFVLCFCKQFQHISIISSFMEMMTFQIDYTQPHPSRPLEIKVDSRSIFVDPEAAKDVSPLFTNFLVRELVAG